MTEEELSIRKLISCSKPTEAEKVAYEIIGRDEDTIKRLKKEKHDLKFEIRQLRERVDKLEQQDIAHRKCHVIMDNTIMMQFTLINALSDLTKGLAEDVTRLRALVKEEK